MSRPPEHIVIIGDDLITWMSAAFFAKLYANTDTKITIAASTSASLKSGVSSVQPEFREYLAFMELDEYVFMRHTNAVFKLADFYDGWVNPGHQFFHSYGEYGLNNGAVTFSSAYLTLLANSKTLKYDQYSFCAEAVKSNLFCHPTTDKTNLSSGIKYSWLFNTREFTELLIEYCRAKGVEVIQGKIELNYRPDQPSNIDGVRIIDKTQNHALTADLYINCQKARDIQPTENTFIDWKTEIPTNITLRTFQNIQIRNKLCDVIQSTHFGYTFLKPAREHVETLLFSHSEVITQEHIDYFLKQCNTQNFEQTVASSFRLKSFWKNNVLSLGAAAISLPTHCISDIDLNWRALKHLVKFTPGKLNPPEICAEYNRLLAEEYDHIKDFVRLQHVACSGKKSDYWNICHNAVISDKLSHKLKLFERRGKLPNYEGEAFPKEFQVAFLIGMGLRRSASDPLLSAYKKAELLKHLDQIRQKIKADLPSLSNHEAYLTKFISESSQASQRS